jgi:hypothetical protein
MRLIPTTLIAAALPLVLAGPSQADTNFLSRFQGSYSGSGTVQREQDSSPRNVTCRVTGRTPSSNDIEIAGSCRAAVIVTRQIGASIRYDPDSQRFSGTYTGASRGPAQLRNGRLQGSTLVFDLVYPQVVHGDRNAVMRITNSGNGQFTMQVTDQVDGKPQQTSNVTLSRG